jgi:K+-transporting ATPase ATPase C chain
MRQNFFPAIRLTIVCILFFVVIYPLLIWFGAKASPNHGEGETVVANNKVVGYKLEGQNFSEDKYFSSRPSTVNYNAAGAGGSNKGPTNPDYLKQVQNKIDTFIAHNPAIRKEDIPSELVTASGSGLDPDLSPAAAKIQVKRIAAIRHIDEQKIYALINQNTESPLLGFLGPSKVNVLKLNIALDEFEVNER